MLLTHIPLTYLTPQTPLAKQHFFALAEALAARKNIPVYLNPFTQAVDMVVLAEDLLDHPVDHVAYGTVVAARVPSLYQLEVDIETEKSDLASTPLEATPIVRTLKADPTIGQPWSIGAVVLLIQPAA